MVTLTSLVGVELPIAVAVCNAGGLGSLPSALRAARRPPVNVISASPSMANIRYSSTK